MQLVKIKKEVSIFKCYNCFLITKFPKCFTYCTDYSRRSSGTLSSRSSQGFHIENTGELTTFGKKKTPPTASSRLHFSPFDCYSEDVALLQVLEHRAQSIVICDVKILDNTFDFSSSPLLSVSSSSGSSQSSSTWHIENSKITKLHYLHNQLIETFIEVILFTLHCQLSNFTKVIQSF